MERYQLIDSLLSDGKIVPFDDILSFLRIELRDAKLSESSVRRDIRYMRDELSAPLAYDDKNHGWKYTKPFHFPVQTFSDDEILFLHLMRKLLAQHASDDVLYKSFDTLLQKITPKLDSSEERSSEESLLDRFFVPARPKFLIKPGVSEKVLYALKHNVLLDFYYNSRWEPEERHRRIMPFQIVIDEGALYLYGAKKSPNPNPRLFKLSKMHNVELLLSETFVLPKNFRFHEDFEKGRFGAFQYDEWYEFKIEFYGEARGHVRDFLWADDQTIEENQKEEKTTLTFTSSQWIPIIHWVLSFGKNAKPIALDWFVAEIENEKLKDEN